MNKKNREFMSRSGVTVVAYFNRDDVEAVKAAQKFYRARHGRGHPRLDTVAKRMALFCKRVEELHRLTRCQVEELS